MSILNNIKLNYITKTLNQCVESKDFTNFEKNFENLKKIDTKIANKYIKFNSIDFVENEDLNFLFNKNIIWANSFRKKDTILISNLISQLFQQAFNTKIPRLNFYEDLLKILDQDDIQDYKSFNDVFLKSHYYFQMILDNKYPGVKLMNTNSAFFEFDKKIHLTHHKLTRCYFYVLKHPYQIFNELKKEGLETQAALNILSNFEDKPEMVKIEKDGKQITCPENAKSWETNVLSWTNENVEISLRGLTVYYDDLLHKTEDKLIEIAAHLKESGSGIEVNTMEISKIANSFQSNEKENSTLEISNKEKKMIDRECGDLIEKFFSERPSF
ncbi:hypothetical protein N9T31_00805 [Alphaproteobacteria bacterium]|nr:hypothetical protein [Alphaproteobacteria bacterium]